ncbi:MAG: metal-dependent hydrolase [Saprospiraceae bacterium]
MTATTIQLLGHATFKITTPAGKIILLDPWLTNNPFIPPHLCDQDGADLVLITHGHEDHCDLNLDEYVRRNHCTVIANNIVSWFWLGKGLESKYFEPLNLGGTLHWEDVSITQVLGFHVSHIPLSDHEVGFPHSSVGYILQFSDGLKAYFAGDTSVFGDMRLLADIYQPNLAILPIGDRYTMGPLEASHAIRLLRVKQVIPFHYGTFPDLSGTVEELQRLTGDIPDLEIHALPAGGIYSANDNLAK